MKKIKKSLSVILTAVIILMMFSIVPSAAKMTDEQIVTAYDNALGKTARKYGTLKVIRTWEYSETADFSGLKGLDLIRTKRMFSDYDGTVFSGVTDLYFEDNGGDPSIFEYNFEAGWFLWELDDDQVKDATYKTNADGTKSLSFTISNPGVWEKFSAVLDENGYVLNIDKEYYTENDSEYSHDGNEFPVTYKSKSSNKIIVNKVSAKKLELEKNEITLGYKDVAEIGYTITPDNVTFEDVDFYYSEYYNEETGLWEDPYEIVEAEGEDGIITLKALGEGTAYVDVYTYSGNLEKTITVTVKYSFFDRIQIFFEDLFGSIADIFTF